jgi:hypothetical protein
MSATVPWLDPEARTALVKDSDRWSELAERVTSTFTVVDDASAATARDMARKARDVHREIEEKRKTITTPLLAAKNATDALFRPTLDAVARIKRHYEQEIARYDLAREQARAAALVESAAAIARKEVPTEPIPEPVHVDKTSVRHVWEPEIVDADAVPREYCSPDLAKIKAAIWYADTPHKPPHDMPGVRFVLKSIVVVR